MTKRELAVKTFGDDIGCCDGSCVYGPPGGMQTNGGCQCMKGTPVEVRRHALRLSKLLGLALALAASGCLPVTVWEPYEPIHGQKGSGSVAECSWGVTPDGLVATASHCVPNGTGGFKSGAVGLVHLDPDADYAILSGGHPDGAIVAKDWGDPDIGDQACYFDFRGDPNCGFILWVTDDHVGVGFGTRMVIPGDSGSPLMLQENDGLVGPVTQRWAGYFGEAARL